MHFDESTSEDADLRPSPTHGAEGAPELLELLEHTQLVGLLAF